MKWLYAFLVILLTFSTLPIYGVNAANEIKVDMELSPTNITEGKIKAGTHTITLKLPNGEKWVNVKEKLELLKSIMVADVEQDDWNDYKKNKITVNDITVTNNELKINLPQDDTYEISNNQKITINLTPALIENWSGEVKPVSFDIFAQPELSIGGTIIDAPANDLEGKSIELTLLNAYWEENDFKNWSNLSAFLKLFEEDTDTTWSVINTLDVKDPNKFLSFKNQVDVGKYRTLVITLPKQNQSDTAETVEFNVTKFNDLVSTTNYYSIDADMDSTLHLNQASLKFNLVSSASGTLTITAPDLDEQKINDDATTVTIKFELPSNSEWNTVVGNALTKNELELLLEGFNPLNEVEQWKELKKGILASDIDTAAVVTDAQTLTLTIPQTKAYELTENQLLEFKVPGQLLKNVADIPEKQIEIKAEPKVLVTGGSAIGSISHEDLIKGGKTIELTLVNEAWISNIASNTEKRQQLLKWFDWNSLDAPTDDIEAQILAKASVKRDSNQKVTIVLPALKPFKLNGTKPQLKLNNTTELTEGAIQTESDKVIFTIQQADDVKATVTAPNGLTEFDIANSTTGFDITIELQNDSWRTDVFTKGQPNTDLTIVNSADSNQKLTYKVKDVSDKKITLTIENQKLDLSSDANFVATIPVSALSLSNYPINADVIQILDVKAEISGTAIKGLDVKDLEKGGKTLIFTLKNATFADINKIKNEDNLKKMFNNNTSIVNAIKNDSKAITVKGNKLTIKLPAITGTSGKLQLKVPKEMIIGGPYDLDVQDKDGEEFYLTIGAIATAKITDKTYTEASIQKGTAKIFIELDNAKWDPAITTNKSKKNALLKGFTVEEQDKEWDKVIDAIKARGEFTISGDTLTITIPKVSDYALTRDQVVSVKIPKSVLKEYSYDIVLDKKIEIKIPEMTPSHTFKQALTDLTKFIDDNGGLEKIRVKVPKKQIDSVQVTSIDVPGSDKLITTVIVETNDLLSTEKVAVEINSTSNDGVTVTSKQEQQGKSVYTFVFSNIPANSDLKVTLTNNEKVEVMNKKLSKGKKTFTDVPKKPLDGYYSLSSLLTDDKMLKEIFKYYSIDEIEIGTIK